MQIGAQSLVDELKFVVVKHPRDSHVDQATVDAQWQALHYLDRPDYDRVVQEFEAFVAILEGFGAELGYLPRHPATGLDSIYVHDPVVAVDGGVILGNMGKQVRRAEPEAFAEYLRALDVPILGRITPPGLLEGGDVCWLDRRTVAVGQGYRTNAEGIRQFRELLGHRVDQVIPVPLPHWTGPDDCLHLLSFISPVAERTAVVYSRMMPVPFRQWLLEHGWQLIEVPDEEYETFACNVLALAPGVCVMVAGNPVTQSRLEAAGMEVHTFPGQDLCIKGGGGPTCLTRPMLRG